MVSLQPPHLLLPHISDLPQSSLAPNGLIPLLGFKWGLLSLPRRKSQDITGHSLSLQLWGRSSSTPRTAAEAPFSLHSVLSQPSLLPEPQARFFLGWKTFPGTPHFLLEKNTPKSSLVLDLHGPLAFVVPLTIFLTPKYPLSHPFKCSSSPPTPPTTGVGCREESAGIPASSCSPKLYTSKPKRGALPCSAFSFNRLLSWKLCHQELSREPTLMDLRGQNAGSWASSQSLIHLL